MHVMISEYSATSPYQVERPVMLHRWERLAFLHWSFPPDAVQRLLPPALTVEPFDDRAWVGLVPFYMRVGTPRVRSIRWLSEFCETNVRTYVRDAEGRTGIWFFSLDAARLGAVVTARTTYRLPYFWSRMRIVEGSDHIAYSCRRRWPGPRGARSEVGLDIGGPFRVDEATSFDHFLTARWTLFSVRRDRFRFARAFHKPWPLRRATVKHCDDELLRAAGLPRNDDSPIVHYSNGVDVRIGRPER